MQRKQFLKMTTEGNPLNHDNKSLAYGEAVK